MLKLVLNLSTLYLHPSQEPMTNHPLYNADVWSTKLGVKTAILCIIKNIMGKQTDHW